MNIKRITTSLEPGSTPRDIKPTNPAPNRAEKCGAGAAKPRRRIGCYSRKLLHIIPKGGYSLQRLPLPEAACGLGRVFEPGNVLLCVVNYNSLFSFKRDSIKASLILAALISAVGGRSLSPLLLT